MKTHILKFFPLGFTVKRSDWHVLNNTQRKVTFCKSKQLAALRWLCLAPPDFATKGGTPARCKIEPFSFGAQHGKRLRLIYLDN